MICFFYLTKVFESVFNHRLVNYLERNTLLAIANMVFVLTSTHIYSKAIHYGESNSKLHLTFLKFSITLSQRFIKYILSFVSTRPYLYLVKSFIRKISTSYLDTPSKYTINAVQGSVLSPKLFLIDELLRITTNPIHRISKNFYAAPNTKLRNKSSTLSGIYVTNRRLFLVFLSIEIG